MFNPVDRYRVDLTTVVRRLSRSQSSETAIDEMVSHFDGILQEESLKESNEKLAEKKARKRMGSLYKIAFQIVNSPDRVRKALRLQTAMFILLFTFVLFLACTLTPINSWWFRHVSLNHGLMNTVAILFFCGAIAGGVGISVAKRIAWKSLSVVAVVGFLVTAMVSNNMHQEFHMSQEKLTDLVNQQNALEPKVAKIESQVKNILNLHDQSSEAWKKELNVLPGLVRDGDVPYYKEDHASSGAFLYPSKIDYPRDESITYSMTLSWTDDLAIAQNAWKKNAAASSDLRIDFPNRERSFLFWRDSAASRITIWMRGFAYSGMITVRLSIIYSIFAVLGFLIGRVRVFGFDWLRGAKA